MTTIKFKSESLNVAIYKCLVKSSTTKASSHGLTKYNENRDSHRRTMMAHGNKGGKKIKMPKIDFHS